MAENKTKQVSSSEQAALANGQQSNAALNKTSDQGGTAKGGGISWAKANAHLNDGKTEPGTRKGQFYSNSKGWLGYAGGSKKRCAAGANYLLYKAGFPEFVADASQMHAPMSSTYGYSQILHLYEKNKDRVKYSPQEGDVYLTLPSDGNDGKQHMAVYVGGRWVSDFIQRNIWIYSSVNENVRIYRKGGSAIADNTNKTTANDKGSAAPASDKQTSTHQAKTQVQKNESTTTKTEAKPKSEVILSDAQIAEALDFMHKQNYTDSCLKEIRALVGSNETGPVGKETVLAIAQWQGAHKLRLKDGKFGKRSAEKAGIKLSSAKADTPKKSTNGRRGAAGLRALLVDGPKPFANVPPYKGIKTYDLRNLKITLRIQPEELEETDSPNGPLSKIAKSNVKPGNSYKLTSKKEPRGYKVNNPCNISHSSTDIGYLGAQKLPDGQLHAEYSSMLNGTASAMRLLRKKYADKSVRSINTGGYQGRYNSNEDPSLTALRLVWITNFANRMGSDFSPSSKLDLSDRETLIALTHSIALQENSLILQYDFLKQAYQLAFGDK